MAQITLNTTAGSASYALVQDIIFIPMNDKSQGTFNLGIIMADATIEFDEIGYTNDIGGITGIQIFKITGDIHIYQNKNSSARLLEQHNGATYAMHILLTNKDIISTHNLDGSLKKPLVAEHPNLKRYPRLVNFRSFYGVTFQLKDIPSQGRDLHYLVTGNTAEKTDWSVSKEQDFYKKFPFPNLVAVNNGGA